MVCDAGGGTVDLISYEVEATSPRLKLKELVPGSGGMAGSLGLNKRFEEAVKNVIGEEEFIRIKKTKSWFRANIQFDREIKPAFRGKPSEEYFVNFPMADLEDNPASGLESNTWRMTRSVNSFIALFFSSHNMRLTNFGDSEEVKNIFKPLITDILRLIDEQVKEVTRRSDKGPTVKFQS